MLFINRFNVRKRVAIQRRDPVVRVHADPESRDALAGESVTFLTTIRFICSALYNAICLLTSYHHHLGRQRWMATGPPLANVALAQGAQNGVRMHSRGNGCRQLAVDGGTGSELGGGRGLRTVRVIIEVSNFATLL